MAEKISGIYKIECLVNGKIYVGQSVNIIRRFQTHKSQLRNNTHINNYLQRAWNKYGEQNFTFEIIEECKETLDKREIYWIKYFDSFNCENGYNLTLGGGGTSGVPKSEKWYLAMTNALKGKPLLEETKRKLRESKKGIKLTEEHKEKLRVAMKSQYENGTRSRDHYWTTGINSPNAIAVYQFDKNTLEIVNKFDCVSEAERYINVSGCVSSCINKKLYTAGGFYWQKVEDTIDGKYNGKIKKTKNQRNSVIQINSENGEIICSFNSIEEASNKIGEKRAKDGISLCCRGKAKTAYGYKWEYAKE